MDRAWVHSIGTDMTVDEFLKLKGDSGYLIGKNLITCIECKANVKFVAASRRAKAYFSHVKFKETNKACELRVNSYTPEKVRQIRKRESKYRIGYYQQRFEDYVSLALLDTIKKSNLAIPLYKKYRDGEGIVLKSLKTEDDEKQLIIMIRRFRNIDLNKAPWFKIILEKWQSRLKFWSDNEDTFYQEPLENLLTQLNSKVIDKIRREISSFEEKQVKDYIIHLSRRGTEDESITLIAIAIILYLGVDLCSCYPNYNSDKLQGEGFLDIERIINDCKSDLIELDEEKSIPFYPGYNFLQLILIYTLYQFEYIRTDSEIFFAQAFIYLKNHYEKYKDEYNWTTNITEGSLHEFNNFIEVTLANVDFHNLAKEFYGDNAKSPAELRRLSIDKNRGFIYVAWSDYFKDIWKKSLNQKGLSDAVKIGYSDDPDRRKDEIGGNLVPPDSIEICDKWPVSDMKGAEKYIFNKLRKNRLTSQREIFGMSKNEAVQKVDNEISKWELI